MPDTDIKELCERLREHLRLDRKIADSNARRSAHFERHAAALAEALKLCRDALNSCQLHEFADEPEAGWRHHIAVADAALDAYRSADKEGGSND